ncbi:unnamed protein product [Caenorhabditis nigoni]
MPGRKIEYDYEVVPWKDISMNYAAVPWGIASINLFGIACLLKSHIPIWLLFMIVSLHIVTSLITLALIFWPLVQIYRDRKRRAWKYYGQKSTWTHFFCILFGIGATSQEPYTDYY